MSTVGVILKLCWQNEEGRWLLKNVIVIEYAYFMKMLLRGRKLLNVVKESPFMLGGNSTDAFQHKVGAVESNYWEVTQVNGAKIA